MTKEYFIFVNSDNKYETTGADTTTNFYYHVGEILPQEYKKYHVELLDLVIPHNYANAGNYFLPYNGIYYNVKINFKSSHIASNDSFIDIFTDQVPNYKEDHYFNTNTNTVVIAYYFTSAAIIGKNGPKIIIDKPSPIINIKIMYDDYDELINTDNNRPNIVKMLLKFTGIDEK